MGSSQAKLLDEKQASGKEKIVYINGEEAFDLLELPDIY